jgi:hypothetical protein
MILYMSLTLNATNFSNRRAAKTPTVDIARLVFDVEDREHVDEVADGQTGQGGLIHRLPIEAEHMEEACCIAYSSTLLQLAAMSVIRTCTRKGCRSPTSIRTETAGTAMYLKWVCRKL